MYQDRLNVFQVAVLGLARAGFREPGDIGPLLGLDGEIVKLVRSDLQVLGHLDRYGVLTANGRNALHDGFPDPTRTITTYVYQDVTTGTLWPASTVEPEHCRCDWRSPRSATLQLRTAGAPLRVSAFAVHPEGTTNTEPPAHEQVVEAVARGEAAKRQGSGHTRRLRTDAPQRIVSRVSVMTEGQPVWIPLPLRTHSQRGGADSAVTWDAISPFGGHASPYLRRLVAIQIQRSPSLREHVERFIGRRTEGLLSEFDLLDVKLRRSIGETLEQRFTDRIRSEKELFEVLTLLEQAIDQARRHGDGSREVAEAARFAWSVHELVLRRIVAQHRPPQSELDRLRDPLVRQLGECCQRLGMSFGEQAPLRLMKASQVKELFNAGAEKRPPTAPLLLAASLVSAAHGGPDHPFRQIAAARSTLIGDLIHLSGDRNSGSHAAPKAMNLEFGETAWRLAQDTAAAYLGMPLPDLSTRSERDSSTHGR
ncbi:hypothetical protein Dvina_40830 [Dactylosporangium vinaceum]|uniref:Uncharacterized protein n=1 Tax=Dactylosporangium vinaceum TaxID=53362 RepID=A0ABV5M3P3_9ACTN|nr:hypothetical protein [Dactylosporangium vinaceum]UAB94432.1 hypothetical protein Dvina_40830 [Dactylosporangium vinaceum]